MRIEDIRRVLILGAGTMGRQIGTLCAMHGYDVVLYDIASESLEGALSSGREIHRPVCNRGASDT